MENTNQTSSIYEDRILAFVDILGFKDMIGRSADDSEKQRLIRAAMDIIHSYKVLNDAGEDGGLRKFGVQVTTFSDSAILSYPVSFDGGLFHVLLDLIHLQIDLAYLGVLIRGGVTIGLAYHDEVNAFGPAMVEAYELESGCAVYPRIILTSQTIHTGIAVSHAHRNPTDIALLKSVLRQAEDGFYYLDYLRQFQELDYPEYDYYRLMVRVRENLICNLNQYYSNQKVFSKYHWMLRYWNGVLDPQSLIVPREEGISDEQAKEVFASYVRLRIVDEYPYK